MQWKEPLSLIHIYHASFCEIPGSLFAIRDVVKEAGIRSCLCYEVSERDGEEKTAQSIKENADFAKWAKDADVYKRQALSWRSVKKEFITVHKIKKRLKISHNLKNFVYNR